MEESVCVSCTIDNMTAIEVKYPVNVMKLVLPNITKLISPVLEVAYNTQYSLGDITLKKVCGSNNGVWHKQISIYHNSSIPYRTK